MVKKKTDKERNGLLEIWLEFWSDFWTHYREKKLLKEDDWSKTRKVKLEYYREQGNYFWQIKAKNDFNNEVIEDLKKQINQMKEICQHFHECGMNHWDFEREWNNYWRVLTKKEKAEKKKLKIKS